jgi:tetratricopeptide (TPR) repeat protein
LDDGLLRRTEAVRFFQDAELHRVVLVAAPEGYGKTALLAERAWEAATLSARAGETFERFVAEAVRRATPEAPGVDRSITSVYAKTLERADGPEVLAAWFCRYLTGAPRVIVVDGADAAEDPRIGDFLRAAIAGSGENVRWILAGRDLAALRSCAAGADTALVGEEQLRLTFPELKRLAVRLAPGHTNGELFAIARMAAGSISRAVFLLRCMHFGVPGAADGQTSFEALVERCFAELSERERAETMAGILLEDGGEVEDGALARQISSVLSRLRTTAPFLFEADGRRFQACFRARLAREIRTLIETNRAELFIRSADALEGSGHTASAIALYCSAGAVDRLLAVVERRGGVGLEGEEVHVLREAIALIPEDVRERHGLVVGLRAVDARNRGRHAEAAALFERALTLCHDDHAQSIRYWYAGLGVNLGDPALVQRMLRPSVEFFRSPPPLRASMMALLGVAWSMSGDGERARRWIGRARKIGDASGDDTLAARVYQQAAYVALRTGDLDAAHELGTRAVVYAEGCGWPHVAAITYGILHNVAVERDRFEEIGTYARRLAEQAARAGNVALHYVAVAACFEYETERCNLPAIAELRAELERFDVSGSPAVFGERHAELPARALQTAWEGRFAGAFRLVEPLLRAFESAASDPAGADPAAFSAAAVYAAAGSLRDEAERALHLYRAAVALHPRPETLHRARIQESLALWLLAKRREADLVMRSVLTQLPATRNRLRVYAELVTSVMESTESAVGPAGVPLEEEMYANGWGGLARFARSVLAGSRAVAGPPSRRSRAFG